MRRLAIAARLALLASGGLAACSSPTQLVVTADTDIAEIDGVVFEIDATGIGAGMQSSNAPLSQGVPAFVSLVHEGGPLGPVVVRAVGRMGGATVVSRDARVSFVAGQTRVLRLDLTQACAGVACADAQTCAGGACVGVDVAATALEEWTGEPPRLGDVPDGGLRDAGPRPPDAGFDAGRPRDGGADAGCATSDPCNLIDDDCDGFVDEDTALESDPTNCGSCGVTCVGACVARVCDDAVAALAVGDGHACASSGATLACWGGNADGQLGDGTTTAAATPTTVALTLTPASSLAAGDAHACLAGAEARCWGANGAGQLGDGSTTGRPSPVGTGVLNTVEACGGAQFTCARLAGGGVECWGRGAEGQLGDGTMPAQRSSPGPVMLPSSAVSLACGAAHACAALTDGRVLCWGDNGSAQLGRGGISPASATPMPAGSISDAVEVAAGQDHSCARTSAGSVLCWGRNTEGQIGNGSNTLAGSPQPVMGLADAIDLGLGGRHSCAVRRVGRVACWGANGRGQLGTGAMTPSNVPVLVTQLFDASRVAAADGWSCARSALSGVLCWGENPGGLGDGSATQSARPVQVSLP